MEAQKAQQLSSSRSSIANTATENSKAGSVASADQAGYLDRDVLAQKLDKIHSTASRNASLTTFNDFGPPPHSRTLDNEKEPGKQSAQQSVGSLYSRFVSSVSGPQGSPQPTTKTPKTDGVEDGPSTTAHGEMAILSEPGSPTQALLTRNVTKPGTISQATAKSTSASEKRNLSAQQDSPMVSRPAISSQNSTPETSSVNDLAQGRNEKDDAGLLKQKVEFHPPEQRQGALEQTPKTSPPKSPPVIRQDLEGESRQPRPLSRKPPSSPVQTVKSNPERSASPSLNIRSGITLTKPPTNSSLQGSLQRLSEPRPRSKQSRVSPTRQPAQFPTPTFSSQYTPSEPDDQNLSIGRKRSKGESTAQMQRKILSRDLWMKDENAKLCFQCGERFSTFKRKHHCRLCGQIFCNNCTILISGKPFGHASKLRVCNVCKTTIDSEDSSDVASSDEDYTSSSLSKTARFSNLPPQVDHLSRNQTRPGQMVGEDQRRSSYHEAVYSASPAGERRRSSSRGLSLERQSTLSRPGSSRSLKSTMQRPRSSSYRSRRSKHHQHMRSLGYGDNAAPFHRSLQTPGPDVSFPAFQTDAIIDPDLAPFMSDEDLSEEDTPNIAAAIHSDGQGQSGQNSHFLSAIKRARLRPFGKSHTDTYMPTKDSDAASITSSKTGYTRRQAPVRTMSSGSITRHVANSPRVVRSLNLFNSSDDLLGLQKAITPQRETFDLTESRLSYENLTSLRLHRPIFDHVKKLFRQFLGDAKVGNHSRWEKALLPIFIRCAHEVEPSIHRHDDIDIRHYLKVKKAPGGRPIQSTYVSGVVFSKNVALKGMSRDIANPRILLIAFPIAYTRQQQHFMSLEPVIAQETEYLKNLVSRVVALKPDVLLVHKDVSGVAMQFLQKAKIAVAHNVKYSVMQAVSRCTETRIVTSMDKLSMDAKELGTCRRFYVKTIMQGNIRKSYIYFSGCQKDLGCTIVLRGADEKTLARVKRISEFMCYVAYNVRLEISLFRDEFIALPTRDDLKIVGASPDKADRREGSQGVKDNGAEELEVKGVETRDGNTPESIDTAEDNIDSVFTFEQLQHRILSVSPSVKLSDPYLLRRGREQEQQIAHLRRLQHTHDEVQLHEKNEHHEDQQQKFELVDPEIVFEEDSQTASPQVREVLHAIHKAEYEKAAHIYAVLKRRWESYISGSLNPRSPLAHQKIVVLHSIVSTPTADPCEGPDLFSVEFYHEHEVEEGMEPDMPLGEYIERLCDQSNAPCVAGQCNRTMLEHHRKYVHGDGQITLFVEHHKCPMRGMESTILMWSICKICSQQTQVVPMSSNSYKYSFGKYLELTFWSTPLHPRADACTHDVHREHVRYFGFKNIAVRIQYEPINIMEVIVPRPQIAWKVEKDLRLKNELYKRMDNALDLFYTSVRHRIKSIKMENILPDKAQACKAEMEKLLGRATEEFNAIQTKLREKYILSKYFEVVPLNRALRFFQEKASTWNTIFTDFEKNYFPSERDIGKLATAQLKQAFLDQEESALDSDFEEKTSLLTPEKTSVDDIVLNEKGMALETASLQGEIPQSATSAKLEHLGEQEKQLVQNLDLALPSEGTVLEETPTRTSDRSQALPFRTDLPSTGLDTNTESARRDSVDSGSTRGPDSPTLRLSRLSTASPRPRMQPLTRAQTQPTVPTLGSIKQILDSLEPLSPRSNDFRQPGSPIQSRIPTLSKENKERRLPESVSNAAMKAARVASTAFPSMIPRAVQNRRHHSRVSALAKHFEQMSREFEMEQVRERKRRTARSRMSVAYPLATARPIVEVYDDPQSAVRDREASQEVFEDSSEEDEGKENPGNEIPQPESPTISEKIGHVPTIKWLDRVTTPDQQPKEQTPEEQPAESKDETAISPTAEEPDQVITSPPNEESELSATEPDLAEVLPKYEKSSLLKMLTSFWSERSASGWEPLEFPLKTNEHIFADNDVIVREDEPSSLIAFSLNTLDHTTKIRNYQEKVLGKVLDEERSAQHGYAANASNNALSQADAELERILLNETGTNMSYRYQSGPAHMTCKVFYAEAFDALRRKCGVAERFVGSLSRCIKWDSRGGKSKSLFLKTLDERFVLKSLSSVEVEAFLNFAPDYFDYMGKCLFHGLPSALAKMLGCYQVVIRNPHTGTNLNVFLQVMENVFYEGPTSRIFDLKGSMRNRKIQSTGQDNEVLLDENLLDYISHSPVYVRNHSNSILTAGVANDSLFCAKQNVMDYSLLVGLYDDRRELLVGVIDYIRTYTWDKKFESWIKDRGKNRPTVRSPKDYRNRFRKSIPRYFPLAPSCWQVFGPGPGIQAPRPLEPSETDLSLTDAEAIEGDGENAGQLDVPTAEPQTGPAAHRVSAPATSKPAGSAPASAAPSSLALNESAVELSEPENDPDSRGAEAMFEAEQSHGQPASVSEGLVLRAGRKEALLAAAVKEQTLNLAQASSQVQGQLQGQGSGQGQRGSSTAPPSLHQGKDPARRS